MQTNTNPTTEKALAKEISFEEMPALHASFFVFRTITKPATANGREPKNVI